MPGLGSESKIGIAKESTPGTGVVPSTALPFTSENFSASAEPVESATIGGSSMLKNVTDGDPQGTGGINQEFDAESSGILLDLWNGPNGYTPPGSAWTEGQITAAPTGVAGSTGGTIPAGNYIYRVAPIWKHDFLKPGEFLMPRSAASSAVSVTLGQKVTLSFTNPAGLSLDDHTYHGTAIYRTVAGGSAGTETYIGCVIGTGSSFEDDGSNEYADASRVPVPNTNMYQHIMEGAEAAEGEDRLEYFTAQVSKNVGKDEQFVGNKVNTFALAVAGRGTAITLATTTLGDQRLLLPGEFAAAAPVPRQPIMGKRAALVLAGDKNCDIQSLNLNGNNNCSRQETLCGVSISDGNRRVNGDLTLIYRNTELLERAINGEEMPMILFCIGEPLSTGAALTAVSHGIDAIPYPRLARFSFPRVKLSGFSNPVPNGDQIIASASWNAQESLSLGYDMQIMLINTLDDYT